MLNTNGKVEYVVTFPTYLAKTSSDVSGATASAPNCTLSWSESMVTSNTAIGTPSTWSSAFRVSFRDIDHLEASTVFPEAGKNQVSPETYVLYVVMALNKRVHVHLHGNPPKWFVAAPPALCSDSVAGLTGRAGHARTFHHYLNGSLSPPPHSSTACTIALAMRFADSLSRNKKSR